MAKGKDAYRHQLFPTGYPWVSIGFARSGAPTLKADCCRSCSPLLNSMNLAT
jgi:hypothetical protein